MSDFNATQFVKQRARKTSGVVTGVVTALAVAGVLVLAALVKLQTNTNQGEQGNEQKPGQPAAAAPPAQPAQPVNAADQPVDNDLTLIREFLAANTNTGEWEEVEVFEAVSVSYDQWSVFYRNVFVANEGDAEL
jgi:cellulase/cellobiase CelA1